MFIMVSCPSPLADFENNSSPHSQGWSPGLGMGHGAARLALLLGRVPVPVLSKAEHSVPSRDWAPQTCSPALLSVSVTHMDFPPFHQFYAGSNLHVAFQQLG